MPVEGGGVQHERRTLLRAKPLCGALAGLFAVCLVALSAQAPPQQPTWQIAKNADAVGFDAKRLAVLREWLETQHTSALVIWRDGNVAFQYGDVARVSKVASVRKSILAMLYGKYVVNGTIDLDVTVKQLALDDVQPFQPIEEQATLRHLLMARSGIYHPAGNAQLEALSPKRGSQTPGTYFQYQNWDFNAAGTAFEKRTGKDLFDALDIDLARPIGMEDFDRGSCARRSTNSTAAWCSARDPSRRNARPVRGWSSKKNNRRIGD